jgi:predicted RNA-binding protein
MKKIVLISCVSKKRSSKSKARELYISPLFKKNLHYALKLKPDQIFILSAKYGLVPLDEEIEPYDLTLNTMSSKEVKDWSAGVLRALASQADLQQDKFVFLAGAKYRKYLVEHLAHVEIPFEGLTIGKQLQQLTKHGNDFNV